MNVFAGKINETYQEYCSVIIHTAPKTSCAAASMFPFALFKAVSISVEIALGTKSANAIFSGESLNTKSMKLNQEIYTDLKRCLLPIVRPIVLIP